MVTVEYSSNNSGGSFWLNDKDWKALEKAGWSEKIIEIEAPKFIKHKGAFNIEVAAKKVINDVRAAAKESK